MSYRNCFDKEVKGNRLYFTFIGNETDRQDIQDDIDHHGLPYAESELFVAHELHHVDPAEVVALTDGAIVDDGLHIWWDASGARRSIVESALKGEPAYMVKAD